MRRYVPLAHGMCAVLLLMTGLLVSGIESSVNAAPAAEDIVPVVPDRLLDTRNGIGAPVGKVRAGATIELTVTGGASKVPADATAVALNITAVEADQAGFVTVWPCGASLPNASNLNMQANQTIPNLVIAKVGSNGKVCIYTNASTHLLADINGFWGAIVPDGAPPAVDVSKVQSSAAADPSGSASVTGPPAAGEGIGVGPEMATVGAADPLDRPTAEEAAKAVGAPGAGPVMPTFSQTDSSLLADFMIANEPTYPIGAAGYATGVDKAIGRVVMWTYSDARKAWERASSCSGTVVGPNMVLTAAHCLDSTYDYYSFIPGLYGDDKPVGEWFAPSNRAYAHQTWFDLKAQNDLARVVLDYAFIKFDPQYNNGYNLSAYTGSFPILMKSDLVGTSFYNVGYPVEGYYDSNNGGWCARSAVWCFPYRCESTASGVRDFANGWKMVGFGCNGNGGISGSSVFANVGGTWYVVSVNDYGGDNRGRNGQLCNESERSTCSWYMRNSWGPEFRTGWLDALWNQVNKL